jgi:hypothetical protein
MTKIRVACVVLAVVLFSLSSAALAGGVEAVFYEAGTMTVGMFTNTVGAAVTGLHIEFDREVTIVNKVEFGGYLPLLGELAGTAFDFAGGGLVANGAVELDWEPAEARPSLVQWISGTAPVGTPYFTSIEVLGRLLGEGIVMVREANPELLAAAFEQFFTTNAEFFGALEESLGMSLQESLMPIIMAAPAEAIANFFNTIVGMLGVTTLDEVLQGDVDFSALFALLGL